MALSEADLIAATAGRESGPRRVKVIRPVSFSVRDLWSGLIGLSDYRDLLIALSAHRLKVRYKQSVLGIAWAIIQPVALMLIYTLVFSIVTKVKTTGVPYAVFAYAALLPWSFFSTALTNATNGLVSHAQLVTKVYFPREILPISYVVAALVDLLVASIVMSALMLWFHVPLTLHLLWVIPITLVMTAFVSGCSLIFSAMQVRVRDIGMAMPLLLQLWMFASPVVYPLHQVPERYRQWYVLNPMVGIIENFRASLLGTDLDTHSLWISTVVAAALLPLAYLYFKRIEATVADVI
ncbi:MAG TPA: ABC transporter permease [Gemmatimonadaceae bacterium]|jgi:lipopolysaccharide transport system permease protein|nr:ABC transporter permease [Gemmatimonadaceae bacterium]